MSEFSRYTYNDFDKYNCLKLSVLYYFIALFLLRAVVISILSFVNLRDKLALAQWFYPDPKMLYLNIATGIPGLFLIYVLINRKPGASDFVKSMWSKFYRLSLVLIALDLILYWSFYFVAELGQLQWLIGQSLLAILLLSLTKFHHRAKLNLTEFPEELEAKKGRRLTDIENQKLNE
ncbi:DUF2919 family protein [Thalassotalea crassostreae]|uniref:DUF2919 family protein n=1 Tax=Thalassotalea crassostreae TaxID=1763536 RepID=UPI0008394C42|nr:DUF2919 family protein [Thalassotalea crassostreae]